MLRHLWDGFGKYSKMDARCRNDSFYLGTEDSHVAVFGTTVYILIGGCIAVCVFGVVVGLLVYVKACRLSMTVMSSGVVRKLALLPEVKDSLLSQNKKPSTIANFVIQQEEFIIHRYFVPLFLATSGVLFFAYVSVFVTSQWELTDECTDKNLLNVTRVCHLFLSVCPPVNCTRWNELGRRDTLICFSFNPDFFNPLEKFVSLLAVQATVLQGAAVVVNRGWGCKAKGRFCAIYIFYTAFLVALVSASIAVYLAAGDFETRYAEVSIPLAQFMFVSVAEAAVLGGFICSLFLSSIHKEEESERHSRNQQRKRRQRKNKIRMYRDLSEDTLSA